MSAKQVLYAVNELVPSTLMVMPLYWFQEMVVREERASSVGQTQVSRLQKRQDELLHALLPPQIVQLRRSGAGVLMHLLAIDAQAVHDAYGAFGQEELRLACVAAASVAVHGAVQVNAQPWHAHILATHGQRLRAR